MAFDELHVGAGNLDLGQQCQRQSQFQQSRAQAAQAGAASVAQREQAQARREGPDNEQA